ncbi:hypothetical protein MRX96_039825 [Rhipicephalus microplus]
MKVTVEGTEITPKEFRTTERIAKAGKHVKELRTLKELSGPASLVPSPALPDRTAVSSNTSAIFAVQDMDSIFAKYFLVGLAAALVTLIIAPNSAGAIPPGVVENAANALSQAFGRNEESAEE